MEEVEGAEEGLVDVFHDLVVVFNAKEVFGDLGLKHECEVAVGVGGAFGFGGFFIGVADDAFLYGGGGKLGVEAEGVVVLKEEFEGLHLRVFPVGVGPVEREGVEEAFAAEGDVVVGEAHGVERDKNVGHDAAAAEDGAAVGGAIAEGVGEMDGVGVDKFAMFIAFGDVVAIGVGAFVVGALDAAAGRGIVARRGETYLTAVGEGHHALDETLAERAATDECAAVPILDGAGDDFGGRGGAFVDEDDEGVWVFAVGAEVAAAVGVEVLVGSATAFLIDDELAAVEEFVGEVAGDVEEAAGVAAEVENKGEHALFFERFEGFVEFVDGGAGEACEADVTDGGVGHEVGVNGVDGDFVACDLEVVDSALTEDVEVDDGAFFSTEVVEDELVVDGVAGGGLAVDADDFVAYLKAYFLGGATVDNRADDDGVGDDLKGDADAFEVALEWLIGSFNVLGGDVDAMGVEGFEHGVDGDGGEFIHVGVLGVVAVDEGHDLVDAELAGGDRVGDEGALGVQGIEN